MNILTVRNAKSLTQQLLYLQYKMLGIHIYFSAESLGQQSESLKI